MSEWGFFCVCGLDEVGKGGFDRVCSLYLHRFPTESVI